MRVDAHHHVWRLTRGDYGWLKPTAALLPIYRDFGLRELRPLLRWERAISRQSSLKLDEKTSS